ncbi:cal-1 [Symbiodinium microadriaticum]|nr:cal-1 [Symbiodinium microadriaticum]
MSLHCRSLCQRLVLLFGILPSLIFAAAFVAMGQQCCGSGNPTGFSGASHEEMLKQFGDLSDDAAMAAVVASLAQITEAMSCVERIQRSLNYEMAQIKDAFRRFDADSSGHLDQNEFKYLCAYIGTCSRRQPILNPKPCSERAQPEALVS